MQTPSKQKISSRVHRISELDGIRGVGFLFVVARHFSGAADGSFAIVRWLNVATSLLSVWVDAFFVISGFLITRILLSHKDSPNYYRTFYMRRILRIFPPYFLLLFFYLAMVWIDQRTSFGLSGPLSRDFSLTPYFIFMQNIQMAVVGTIKPHFLGHTWSIAIEEQFYFVLPLLIRVIPKKNIPAAFILLAISAPIFRFVMCSSNPLHFSGNWWARYTLLPSRFDTFFSGALLACFFEKWDVPGFVRRHISLFYGILTVLWSGFIVLTIKKTEMLRFDNLASGYSWLALCAAFTVLVSLCDSHVSRFFRTPLFVHWGRLSYTMYLFHTPCLFVCLALFLPGKNILIKDGLSFVVMVLSFFILWGFSYLSWELMEKKLIAAGKKFQY